LTKNFIKLRRVKREKFDDGSPEPARERESLTAAAADDSYDAGSIRQETKFMPIYGHV